MDPRIEQMTEKDDTFTFTLSGVNTSIANAVRRVVLSDIPTVVFKTAPYEECQCTILENTSRFNNEIIKQRLSSIPIHITDLEIPLNQYLMEVNIENLTDTIMYVTTEDFKIKNIQTNQYLSEKDTRSIFPASQQTGYFIDFLRLRPKLSENSSGEKIHLTCQFSIHTCKEDGMFNVVSTCSYGCTVDETRMQTELGKKRNEWKEQNMDVDFETKNWMLLDGKRIIKKDSFDFIIQSVGVFDNKEIVIKACDILLKMLSNLNDNVESKNIQIHESENTMQNCFDIIIENEDYTIGKIVEFILYAKFYQDTKLLSYCGFKKMHPHDKDSIIRVAYYEPVDKSAVLGHLKISIDEGMRIYKTIKEKL